MGAGKKEFENLKLRRATQLTFMEGPVRCHTLSEVSFRYLTPHTSTMSATSYSFLQVKKRASER